MVDTLPPNFSFLLKFLVSLFSSCLVAYNMPANRPSVGRSVGRSGTPTRSMMREWWPAGVGILLCGLCLELFLALFFPSVLIVAI